MKSKGKRGMDFQSGVLEECWEKFGVLECWENVGLMLEILLDHKEGFFKGSSPLNPRRVSPKLSLSYAENKIFIILRRTILLLGF